VSRSSRRVKAAGALATRVSLASGAGASGSGSARTPAMCLQASSPRRCERFMRTLASKGSSGLVRQVHSVQSQSMQDRLPSDSSSSFSAASLCCGACLGLEDGFIRRLRLARPLGRAFYTLRGAVPPCSASRCLRALLASHSLSSLCTGLSICT